MCLLARVVLCAWFFVLTGSVCEAVPPVAAVSTLSPCAGFCSELPTRSFHETNPSRKSFLLVPGFHVRLKCVSVACRLENLLQEDPARVGCET